MKIPFLTKPAIKKVTGEAFGTERAQLTTLVNEFLQELPELLTFSVVDIKSARVLVAYTSQANFDPYKLATHNTKVVKEFQKALTASWLGDQQMNDLAIVLEDQFHIIRLMPDRRRYCHLAVKSSDTNMAIAREIMRSLAK
ncbi:hypothetical protein [Hymenobacter sp. GOD-10R]|uniref:hypothetical protein n=1 Tax=Hymenobacter sp. GOD-10R TaxID=3093922 RepID=UPI002D76DB05|nr:hypothetical protein [Hymenobacter sp. GOD-10R]WRQ29491.1 hypothetical protein SD425_04355 [Hymenobacter sp. GOD-10R]